MLKASVLNLNVPHNITSRYIKQRNTAIIVGHFNKPLSLFKRLNRPKMSKDIEYLSETINKIDSIEHWF